MAEESQSFHVAPSRIYQKSEEEIAIYKQLHEERSSKCFVYVFAGFVFQCFVLLVFAMIVLKVKTPDVKLESAMIENLIRYGNSSSPSFNVTMVAQFTIKNTNFGPFKYENSSVSVLCEGTSIGDRNIGSGKVKGRGTKRIDVTVKMRSNTVLKDRKNLGVLIKLTSYTKLSGRVHLMKIINNHKTAEMNCTMNLNLTGTRIQDLLCE